MGSENIFKGRNKKGFKTQNMKYLITGGCGFIGSNLAAEVLERGEELVVFDNLFRFGSGSNLEWLKQKGEFKYYPFDIRNLNDIETVIKEEQPDVVFHLAGQVAMTTSIFNPRLDFEINAMGTFNLLDSIRKYSPDTMILYSSSNKVYGDFKDFPTFLILGFLYRALRARRGAPRGAPTSRSPQKVAVAIAAATFLRFKS